VNRSALRPLPPLPPAAWTGRRARPSPFPLDGSCWRVYRRARHALYRGVPALGLGPGDEVLVPAYHHGSEVEALVAAGLDCRFYEAGDGLAPDGALLEALLGPRTRALHLIHYLGFPQDAARWRAWCDARGLLLLEDAAQAWLGSSGGRPLGSYGDLAIFCAYKTFGVPDGGLLVLRSAAAAGPAVAGPAASGPAGRRRLGLRAAAGSHLKWLWQRLPAAGTGPAPSGPAPAAETPYDPAADFALGDPDSRPAATTLALLRRFDWRRARQARRRNYGYLADRLAGRVRPLFPQLADGAVPFVFPVCTADKRTLLDRLRRCGVTAFDLWSVPHPTLPAADFPRAGSLRAGVVALPVHQELRRVDLDRIAEAVIGAGP
jgi:dTDP-4-amino-4,6-dideoxygalactose transaminase